MDCPPPLLRVLLLLTLTLLAGTAVVPLADDNLDAAIATNGTLWLLFFNSPDCQPCKTADALIAEAAPRLDVPVGRVLCTVDGLAQCERFDVHTVPRLVLVSATENVFRHYDQPVATSTEEDLQQFVNKRYQSLVAVPLPPPPPPRGPSYVEVLGDANLTLAETSEDTWMVDFFHPQCHHCRNLEPIFAALSAEVRDDAGVKLAAVNLQQNDLSMKRYRIFAYPTIVVLRQGKYHVYEGERTVESLKEFLYDPTFSEARPIPKPDFGVLDLLEMFFSEVVDALQQIWRDPHLRMKVGKVLLIGLPICCAVSFVLVYFIMRCMGEFGPSVTVNDAKKND